MKKEFTFSEQMKLWIDYMVTIVGLNNDVVYHPIMIKDMSPKGNGQMIRNQGVDFSRGTEYPVLNVLSSPLTDEKFPILSFEDFIKGKMDEWYWKFKDRINWDMV